MYQDNLLNFDTEKQSWVGDLASIRNMQVADNVAELMAQKIYALSSGIQALLKIAAAIGNTFDLQTVWRVHNTEQFPFSAKTSTERMKQLQNTGLSSVALLLWEAVQAELILMKQTPYAFDMHEGMHIDENTNIIYAFQHDRIQQAAYEMISETERPKLHLHIGRILLQSTSERSLPDNIISIAYHLNYGIDIIKTPQEKEELAQFNLLAAKKAKDSSAYIPALQYCLNGIRLYPR